MRLERLTLQNFRGFESLDITFDPSFTVLLGGNMAGKTAVLDAAAIALSEVTVAYAPLRALQQSDARRTTTDIDSIPDLRIQGHADISVVASSGLLLDTNVRWRVEEAPPVTLRAALSDAVMSEDPVLGLPLLVFYGTNRGWDSAIQAPDIRGVGSRVDGYSNWSDAHPSHATFLGWIRKQTLVELQRKNYTQPQLAAVEAAVKTCIAGIARFWFDVQYDELRLERRDRDIQEFSMLSEGYRNIVAMVADIAWRAAVLNPQHGDDAAKLTDGIVLIDELDLHLHPSWQRRIVDDLRRTFPKIQFIVTTHSPQIVASVAGNQVRLLDQNRLVDIELHVEGRDANELLEDVFGVPSRPEGMAAEIDDLYQMIEDERFDEARTRLASIEQRLGPDDAAMVRARWILDTESPQPTSTP